MVVPHGKVLQYLSWVSIEPSAARQSSELLCSRLLPVCQATRPKVLPTHVQFSLIKQRDPSQGRSLESGRLENARVEDAYFVNTYLKDTCLEDTHREDACVESSRLVNV